MFKVRQLKGDLRTFLPWYFAISLESHACRLDNILRGFDEDFKELSTIIPEVDSTAIISVIQY